MSGAAPIVILGGGEHARVVIDAARSAGLEIAGYASRARDEATDALGVRFLGDDVAVFEQPMSASFVIAIGSPEARRSISLRAEVAGVSFARVVHTRSIVSPDARIAAGAQLMAGAIVNIGANVGRHVIVNTGAIVEHDVVLGDYVHVCPGATLGGGAKIGAGVTVGLGARVRDHVTVGDGSFIGMGAVVVSDIPAGSTVFGVPARPQETTP